MSNLLIPLLCSAVALYALGKGVHLSEAFAQGAQDGLHTLLRIFPALLFLLPMIALLRASGLLDALTQGFAPFLQRLSIPAETAPILFLRPFSGSGALAAATDIMETYGADSPIGRTAAVMLGSTETTFYVLTVYLAGVKHIEGKQMLIAALFADLVGFIMASVTVNLWF